LGEILNLITRVFVYLQKKMAAPADQWKNKGNTAYSAKNYNEAVKCYSEAIKLDTTNNPALFTNRAAAYAGLNDWEKSLADANKSLAINPEWLKGHFRKGAALFELKRWEDATQAYKKAVQLDPQNQDITSKLKEAEQMWKKNKPKVNADGSPLSAAQLAKEDGNEFFRLGKIDKAIESYTKALNLCTDKEVTEKSHIYNNRAACYVQLYEPVKVIADCTESLTLLPMNPKALMRRGLAYESTDKMRLALDDFRKVLSLDPRNTVAVTASSRITNALKAQGKRID